VVEDHSYATVKFLVSFPKDSKLDRESVDKIMTLLKLETSIILENMHAFDAKGKIKVYDCPEEIIEEFYPVRFQAYSKRKRMLLSKLEAEEIISRNRARFVTQILSGDLDILTSTRASSSKPQHPIKENDLIQVLQSRGYASQADINKLLLSASMPGESSPSPAEVDKKAFAYLLDLPIQSLTQERSINLTKKAEDAKKKFQDLQSKSEADLWLADLEALKLKAMEMGYIADPSSPSNDTPTIISASISTSSGSKSKANRPKSSSSTSASASTSTSSEPKTRKPKSSSSTPSSTSTSSPSKAKKSKSSTSTGSASKVKIPKKFKSSEEA
jgi:DNA topoisomerase II